MAHQINITLTDDEYKALTAKVGKDDRLLEKHLHELLALHLYTSLPRGRSLSERNMQHHLSQRGITYRIPTDQPEMPEEEEEAEDERLFVSADTDLIGIAQAEGFEVENPNDH